MGKQKLATALAVKRSGFYVESEKEFLVLFLRNLFVMFIDSKGDNGLNPFDETLIKLIQSKDFNSLTELEQEKFKNIFFNIYEKGFELNFDIDLEDFGYNFEDLPNILFENFKKLFSTKGEIEVLKEAFKNEKDFKEYVNSNVESDKVEGVICLIEVPNAEQLMEKLQKTGSTYQINFETIEDEYSFSSKGEIELMFLG